jgi:hypothetical protein
MTVFDRVGVDSIHMPFVIPFVSNQVLPITPLPDPSFALGCPVRIDHLTVWNPPREPRLGQRGIRHVEKGGLLFQKGS